MKRTTGTSLGRVQGLAPRAVRRRIVGRAVFVGVSGLDRLSDKRAITAMIFLEEIQEGRKGHELVPLVQPARYMNGDLRDGDNILRLHRRKGQDRHVRRSQSSSAIPGKLLLDAPRQRVPRE